MLYFLIKSGLRDRLWYFVIFASLTLLGIIAAINLPIDAVPDITNIQVIVNTKTKALDPGKIEKLVTYPIEAELSGVQGVEEIRSLSKYGLSQVVVVFEEGTNIYFARQLVSERIQGIRESLPKDLSPEIAPITTGLGEVLMYVVEAKPNSKLAQSPEKERLLYLRQIQEFTIRPQLKKISGVADIDTNGGFPKQVHINFKPEKLRQYGLSIDKLISKIESLGESFGGGYIQRDGNQIIVRATGQIASLDAISQLPISLNYRGNTIRIKDLADVRTDHALRVGAATHQGEETVLGTVLMLTGANSRAVASRSSKALRNEIKIPDDVDIKIVYSRSHLVNATIRTVLKNLVEGAGLVILVLLLILGNFRAAIIVSLAIPISMLFALKGMSILKISANLMSLGAIDFGLLVDASVVLIENIVQRFEGLHGKLVSRREKFDIVLESSKEVIKPISFGLIIIMLVYIPILYLEGVEGKMFRPMAGTVLLALGGSLLVAIFLMPALAFLFIPLQTKEKEPWLSLAIRKIYTPLLRVTLSKPWVVGLVIIIPTILAAFMFNKLGSDFIPQLDEGDLVINLARDTKQGIDESVTRQKEAENIIANYGEVETVFSRMGTAESALDPMGPYLADTFVILKKDRGRWPKHNGQIRSKDELFDAMEKDLKIKNPQQEITPNQPIAMRFNEILEGSRADISLRIFGPSLDKLLEYQQRSKRILSSIEGIASMESDPLTALTKSPILDVVLDYQKMAALGLSLRDVNGVLENAMSGKEVGSFYEGDRRYPIVLHLDETLRNKMHSIASVPVSLPEGGTVRLSSVASIVEHDEVTTIARSGSQRYSALSIFLKNQDLATFVAKAKKKIETELKPEPDYKVEWGGQFKNLERARETLFIIIPITLALIFILLIKNFSNIRHAALVFSAIPLSVVGGVFSLSLRQIHFSVSAAIGFIALAGIATLNSMVMVTFFNQLRSAGKSIEETVFEGALARLRPVATTALVASLGFIPMALNTGTGAEVQRPLATVVIGGLITSTILTLFVVPIAYRWIERMVGDKIAVRKS